MVERVDRRVLGALRLVDTPSQSAIRIPLSLRAGGTQFLRNRSGTYVITQAQGLGHHTNIFEAPPDEPALGSVGIEISVSDPTGRYLPRTVSVNLPRDPSLDPEDEEQSLFRTIDVDLYRSPDTQFVANWSGLRISLSRLSQGQGRLAVPGALLRVVSREDEEVLARGLTDRRGEGVVVIAGIPITNFPTREQRGNGCDGPVVTSYTKVRLEVIAHPDLPWPPNPDLLEEHRDQWWRNSDPEHHLDLTTGHVETLSLDIDLT